MRISRVVVLAGLVGASAVALATGTHGHVVRVEATPSREVRVPAGTFTMGVSDADAEQLSADCQEAYPSDSMFLQQLCAAYTIELAHMKPRKVYLSAFYIDRLEVSVGDYRECVRRGGCDSDALVSGDQRYVELGDNYPMVNVEWDEAQRYCRWREARLPTEAEWERAARGDGAGPWPWGTIPRPNDFNHGKPEAHVSFEITSKTTPSGVDEATQGEADDSDGNRTLAPVGSYSWGEGPYGTLDMAGNVAEWTADAYLRPSSGGIAGVRSEFDKAGYDDLDTVNPVRIGNSSDSRIVRGGSWRQPTLDAKVYARDPYLEWDAVGVSSLQIYDPRHRLPYVGFRCARTDPNR